ncbi:hypothetical protein CCACVL1_14558 [Corchorus capsularis]|uniref:Uncharacterized protein n=1 Tax=Corchorus capsularis TaxID=210143 RepID=A0A1R3I6L7_COCAP|nr:hypothetical protein CCACVL1_14558 [Corchorus capsularis]
MGATATGCSGGLSQTKTTYERRHVAGFPKVTTIEID